MTEDQKKKLEKATVDMGINIGIAMGYLGAKQDKSDDDTGLLREMDKIAIQMGLLKDPEDYLIENEAPEGVLTAYLEAFYSRIIKETAKVTGASEEQIANKESRTPEQESVLLEISGRATITRIQKYLDSDFILANTNLRRAAKQQGQLEAENTQNAEDIGQGINFITRYYFATHPAIDPRESGNIGDAELADLYAILDRALAIKRKEPHKSFYNAALDSIGVKFNKSKKATAREIGADMEIYKRALSITDKEYQYALTSRPNETAFISPVDKDFMDKLVFEKETGKISFLDSQASEADIKKAASGRKMELVKDLDIQLLRNIYTAIYNNQQSMNGGNVAVYLPSFCKAMGIDMATGKPNDIFGKIRQFSQCIGYTKNGSFYTLLNFSKYDKETNIITFDSPYMNMIIQQIAERNIRTSKKGITYFDPSHSFLIHSNIANERNKAAIEIVHRIIALLHQRGDGQRTRRGGKAAETFTNKTIKAHKKFIAIIKDIPTFYEKLTITDTKGNFLSYKKEQPCNTQLQRAFKKAYELLRTKTDAYNYFKNLNIPEIIPTITTLEKTLVITHNGIEENYKPIK